MIYDLHTHSTASDGALDPVDLVAFARSCGVGTLAVTDHDSTTAHVALSHHEFADITVVAGIEFSTSWYGRGIHVVGLNLDTQNVELADGVARQQTARQIRAQKISERLQKLGVNDSLGKATELARGGVVGRPHFAAAMVQCGIVKDTRTAFRKYLGAGKPGDVKHEWATMTDVIDWIRTAGGSPVLAHPAKYKLTMTRLRELARDFQSAGGLAIEVVCGPQSRDTTSRLAALTSDLGMLGSCGSDFHSPDNSWSRPGKFQALPRDITPVWDSW